MTDDTYPNEIVTVAYCPGCELLSLAGDLKSSGNTTLEMGHNLECPRCGTQINAEHFFDYVDIRVVEYE
jgi:hypothetical protein